MDAAEPTTKLCPKCEVWLDRVLFGRDVSKKDGLSYRCRKCTRVAVRDDCATWSEERKQAEVDRLQTWRNRNAERPAETTPKFCPKCEQLLDRALFRRNKVTKDGSAHLCTSCANAENLKRYYALDDDQKAIEAARAKVLREQNKDAITETARAYRAVNSEKINATKRVWKAANKDTVRLNGRVGRAKRRCVVGSFTVTELADIFRLQQGKCAYCRKSIKGGHHADHIVPIALNGDNNRQNIQLTCQRCNLRKGAKHPLVFARFLGRLL